MLYYKKKFLGSVRAFTDSLAVKYRLVIKFFSASKKLIRVLKALENFFEL